MSNLLIARHAHAAIDQLENEIAVVVHNVVEHSVQLSLHAARYRTGSSEANGRGISCNLLSKEVSYALQCNHAKGLLL